MDKLPVDDEGDIITSASFGDLAIIEITYNTDFDGREIDPDREEYPRTLHGPFASFDEAQEWMAAYPDGDTDIHDMVAMHLNNVRPDTKPEEAN